MMQWTTDFGEYAPGDPHDWPLAYGRFDAAIERDPDSLSGNVLAMTAFGSSGLRRWSRVPAARDIEVFALVRLPEADPLSGRTSYGRTAIRLADDASAYYLLSWDKSNNRLKIERGVQPGRDTLLASAPKVPFAAGETIAVRFRAAGTRLAGRMWRFGESEPATWDIEAVDDGIAKGGVGYRKNHPDATDAYWWFAVGLDGAPAPTPHEPAATWVRSG